MSAHIEPDMSTELKKVDMKHTPEPWTNEPDRGFITADGAEVCQMWNKYEDDFENAEANAARIASCVNACAGMIDPQQAIASLQAENERLRAALDEIGGMTANVTMSRLEDALNDIRNAARAALEQRP